MDGREGHYCCFYPFFGSLLEFQSHFLGCPCCAWPYFEGQFLMVNPAIALLGTRRRRRRRHGVTVSSGVVCYCASAVRVTLRLLARRNYATRIGGTILQDHPTKIQSAATSNRPVACYCLRGGHLYLRTMSLGCPEHNNSVIHPFHDCFCGADDVLCLSVAEICPFQGWKEVCQSRAEDRGGGGCGSAAWTLFVRETVA